MRLALLLVGLVLTFAAVITRANPNPKPNPNPNPDPDPVTLALTLTRTLIVTLTLSLTLTKVIALSVYAKQQLRKRIDAPSTGLGDGGAEGEEVGVDSGRERRMAPGNLL